MTVPRLRIRIRKVKPFYEDSDYMLWRVSVQTPAGWFPIDRGHFSKWEQAIEYVTGANPYATGE